MIYCEPLDRSELQFKIVRFERSPTLVRKVLSTPRVLSNPATTNNLSLQHVCTKT